VSVSVSVSSVVLCLDFAAGAGPASAGMLEPPGGLDEFWARNVLARSSKP
jgi:hypothetical protein